jgi:hypothetical protein
VETEGRQNLGEAARSSIFYGETENFPVLKFSRQCLLDIQVNVG